MDGRVKTLHPRVHGGILSRGERDRGRPRAPRRRGRSTSSSSTSTRSSRRRGRPERRRTSRSSRTSTSAARRWCARPRRTTRASTVVCDPADYARVLAEIAAHGRRRRRRRAPSSRRRRSRTRRRTTRRSAGTSRRARRRRRRAARFPRYLTLPFERAYGLRYGENPHQAGAFYVERDAPAGSLARAESLGAGGKELSFNNLVDVDAALDAVREFDSPAAVVVKHTNPCGVAVGADARRRLPRRARGRRAERVRRHRRAQPRGRRGDGAGPRRDVPRVRRRAVVRAARARGPARQEEPAPPRDRRAGSARSTRRSQYKRVGGGLVVQDRDATAAGRGRRAARS